MINAIYVMKDYKKISNAAINVISNGIFNKKI